MGNSIWDIDESSGGGLPEAPIDGKGYLRKNASWEEATSLGGVSGGAFITNIVPTGSGTVGTKVTSSDGVVLDSCLSDTQLITVSVLGITGNKNYKPNMLLRWGAYTQVVPMVARADKPLFDGSASINLQGQNLITIEHEDGAKHECVVNTDTPPLITSATFTGGYPGTQTELKLSDTFNFNIISNVPIINIEFSDYGAYSAQAFPVASGVNHTITGIIANRGITVQNLGARVRVQKSTGSWSLWHLTESDGSIDGTNLVKLNNLYPTVSCGAITYPASQGALKNVENATVTNNVTNYNVVAYDSPNAELTISNSALYEASKTVTRLNGSYNVSINNFRIIATRTANNAISSAQTTVCIANVACTIAITLPVSRLISGGNDGTLPQNHVVTITSNQNLYSFPTLVAGQGTWQGVSFLGGPLIWARSLQIHDNMVKGAYSFSSLLATNLAGIQTNTILSGSSYTVGGFITRTISLPAFANETIMNVESTDYTKVTLSWDFKPSLTIRSPLGSLPPIVDNWCLLALNTNPSTLRVLDTAATGSCSSASLLTIQESV
jgi:hypothetical protein